MPFGRSRARGIATFVPVFRPGALASILVVATALQFQPPRYTREIMESGVSASERWTFVYGTRDSAATTALRDRALGMARRWLGGDTSAVIADRAAGRAEIERGPVVLFGGPRENEWTRRFEDALPVRFTTRGFRWMDRDYEHPGDVIHLAYPNPLAPRRFLLLIAGNSTAALSRGRGSFLFGDEDWRIVREGELVRWGSFAQAANRPWRYDPTLDHDRERAREQFQAELRGESRGGLTVLASPSLARTTEIRAAAQAVNSRLARIGFDAVSAAGSSLTLYSSLEEKGTLTRDTRPEHLDARGDAHAALPAGREILDLWSVAAARFRRAGASAESRFLEPASVWIADRFEGEALATAVKRLYFGRVLPSAREAATRATSWRSSLIWTPARALLVRAVVECAGPASNATARAALLSLLRRDPAGTLDSLCLAARVDAAVVERRYSALADSLSRAAPRRDSVAPRTWNAAQGFQRGVCFAHSVSLERGYLSLSAARELESIQRLGANWISITPFGYVPADGSAEIFPSADGGPDEENDEALCESAARARKLGLRVWLVPHLWSRGWVGRLEFPPSEWPRFFERYRSFLLHYALLAEREGIDGLVIGHELPTTTSKFPDRWRAMIADVRRVYSGTLTYGAHWDGEAAAIPFWDELDLVGVSFYSPLASRSTRSVVSLTRGAAKALATLRPLSVRWNRPVVLIEVGYAPQPDASVRPWEELRGPPDLEAQRSCYEAMASALDGEDWIAGAFWWKWFSSDRPGGERDASFTPRGKPAELVIRNAFRQWVGRPIRVPNR